MWRADTKKTKTDGPGDWSAGAVRPRVVVEEQDGAAQWAMRRLLARAGYDVAVCGGPEKLPGNRCRLVADGCCPLVAGADVVVNSLSLTSPDNRDVVGALHAVHPEIPVVVEIPLPRLSSHRSLLDGCQIMPFPATSDQVLWQVRGALSRRRHPSSAGSG